MVLKGERAEVVHIALRVWNRGSRQERQEVVDEECDPWNYPYESKQSVNEVQGLNCCIEWRMSSLDESRLLKLSKSEILIWMLKSLRKDRKRGGDGVIKCEALEGILCLVTRRSTFLSGFSEPHQQEEPRKPTFGKRCGLLASPTSSCNLGKASQPL